jgi:hypothetical protein
MIEIQIRNSNREQEIPNQKWQKETQARSHRGFGFLDGFGACYGMRPQHGVLIIVLFSLLPTLCCSFSSGQRPRIGCGAGDRFWRFSVETLRM